jgi:acetolactate synthase-1/3 small subunit
MTATAAPPLHTIALLVRNKPGVLGRIALVFSRRGYNIESLVVSPAFDAETAGFKSKIQEFSRMSITCSGDGAVLEQIVKQLEKLIDVIHAIDHVGQVIESEQALVKIRVALEQRTEVLQIAEHYNAKVVDYGPESLILRVQGESSKLDAFIELLDGHQLLELVRSGKILMARGTGVT